jgi:2-dehydro-3-deoxyphosphooctonate aldolase (KDO 8-P synthase)
MAESIDTICKRLGVEWIFKASFDKANRTSINGKRGVGIHRGRDTLYAIKKGYGVPVLTDVHLPEQCAVLADTVDVIQIPAFLSRQTDLLVAAGKTGKVVNIKKAQFMAPDDMRHAIKKVESTGNRNIWLTERGTSFGYKTLVNDMRSLVIMALTGYPVIFDATHSVQQPSGLNGKSGGDRTMVPHLARAATAVGVAGVFMEVHDDPDNAASDGPNAVRLEDLEDVLTSIIKIDKVLKNDILHR